MKRSILANYSAFGIRAFRSFFLLSERTKNDTCYLPMCE